MKFLKKWSARSVPNTHAWLERLHQIGATSPNWYEESAVVPCQIVLSDESVLDYVEYVVPKTPPIPNRKKTNAEQATFWNRYSGAVLIEEVLDVQPSNNAMSFQARENYHDFFFPMVERVSAAFLNIRDQQGRIKSDGVPVTTWCNDEEFDCTTAEPVQTTARDYHSFVRRYSGPLYALI